MTISYFVFFHDRARPEARIGPADLGRVADILRATPRLMKAHVYTPTMVAGPFSHDGRPPQLVLQLYFAELPALEAAIAPDGHLQALAAAGSLPSLAGAEVTQQAMLARPFPAPPGPARDDPGQSCCTYLVHYPGHAQDLNAWLSYYLSHHPQLMRNMPGIREIEVCTRIDWCDGMPWKRIHPMQRNKVVFDSSEALATALDSPALHAMREDFRRFPPFTGGNVHYPMLTSMITGDPGAGAPRR